jgi:2-polyprenyl-3-methyl-5-hydroxy-6-metoxy-1,4-benzoquinol methylase
VEADDEGDRDRAEPVERGLVAEHAALRIHRLTIPTEDGCRPGADTLSRVSGTTEQAAPEGIADLRDSYPDPEMSREEDARIARQLQELAPGLDLDGLLDEHWRLVGKRPELAARFTAQERTAATRVLPVVAAIESALGRPVSAGDRVLEVGCGTAALSVALAARGAEVVATDVSLRWLALAQKRLADSGAAVGLVACAAEALPFADGSFDLVAASDVIEHVEDPDRFVAEAVRVLKPGGLLFLATPNRFSLGLEPHVRLWGVGYLPRGLAESYVRAVRKTSYSHVRLLSARALERLLRAHGLEPEVVIPAVPDASLYSGVELRLVQTYNRVRTQRAARPFLHAVGPFFHVFGRKPR